MAHCYDVLPPSSFCSSKPRCPKACHGIAPGTEGMLYEFADFLPYVSSLWGDDLEVWTPGMNGCADESWPIGSSCAVKCPPKTELEYETGECFTTTPPRTQVPPLPFYDISCTAEHDHTYAECSPESASMAYPTYFTWVSKKYNQPILSGIITPTPPMPPKSTNIRMQRSPLYKGPEAGRGCTKFQTCCINGMTSDDFDGRGCGSSNQWADRGHQVPNGLVGMHYGAAVSTFSMCNVGPQSVSLNQADWERLEKLVQCVSQAVPVVILAGPLFEDATNEHDTFQHVFCAMPSHYDGPTSIITREQCLKQGGKKVVPVPYAYFKIVILQRGRDGKSRPETYVWIMDKAQSGEHQSCFKDWSEDPLCCSLSLKTPTAQSLKGSYAGKHGLMTIEKQMGLTFPPILHETIQDGCEAINALAQLGCGKVTMQYCDDCRTLTKSPGQC